MRGIPLHLEVVRVRVALHGEAASIGMSGGSICVVSLVGTPLRIVPRGLALLHRLSSTWTTMMLLISEGLIGMVSWRVDCAVS